eukprot:CAMPEP_0115308008 /NCGR_PEP_ID=MMETSP0270-20121206/73457_1 /TAXON_ID=71861 /ORGANISM="Scrippsiella trochoidea, Strain CCMP3099" /LENGTH=30 /DNA_ID= /DNA_START= /DNA_END= /DNA_ORIENTATION=
MSASVYLIGLAAPFEKFTIANHISELPGGT